MDQRSLFDDVMVTEAGELRPSAPAAAPEPSWAAQWRTMGGSNLPARTPIFEGQFVRFNGYYDVMTGKLDRVGLRVHAVYRLLDRHKIDKERAVELLKQRKVSAALALVENWLAWPLSDKGRTNRQKWRDLNSHQAT